MNKTESNPLILDILEGLKKCNPHILEGLKKCNPHILDHLEKLKELPFCYKHARPYVAIDLCSIGIINEPVQGMGSSTATKPNNKKLAVFIQREDVTKPWCLPGKFMRFAEKPGYNNPEDKEENKSGEEWRDSLERVCHREWLSHIEIAGQVKDEIIEYKVPINEDCMYSVPFLDRRERDPRARVISLPVVTFVGHVDPIRSEIGHVARWVPIEHLLPGKNNAYTLGFDHIKIVTLAYRQLLIEASTRPLGRNLVSNDEDFDLEELVQIYNILFNRKFSKSNLKKQLLDRGVIQSNSKKPLAAGQRRRGERFSFDMKKYEEYTLLPFSFDIEEYEKYKAPLSFTFLPRSKDDD